MDPYDQAAEDFIILAGVLALSTLAHIAELPGEPTPEPSASKAEDGEEKEKKNGAGTPDEGQSLPARMPQVEASAGGDGEMRLAWETLIQPREPLRRPRPQEDDGEPATPPGAAREEDAAGCPADVEILADALAQWHILEEEMLLLGEDIVLVERRERAFYQAMDSFLEKNGEAGRRACQNKLPCIRARRAHFEAGERRKEEERLRQQEERRRREQVRQAADDAARRREQADRQFREMRRERARARQDEEHARSQMLFAEIAADRERVRRENPPPPRPVQCWICGRPGVKNSRKCPDRQEHRHYPERTGR